MFLDKILYIINYQRVYSLTTFGHFKVSLNQIEGYDPKPDNLGKSQVRKYLIFQKRLILRVTYPGSITLERIEKEGREMYFQYSSVRQKIGFLFIHLPFVKSGMC